MDEGLIHQDGDATCTKTRACTNCARLKMKCQWPSSGSGRSEKTCSRYGLLIPTGEWYDGVSAHIW
jgi:hypothetical protein